MSERVDTARTDFSREDAHFKSGFVALIGRPSVGKSSLLNALLGNHVAIASKVAQTTRKRLRGILNEEGAQIIFVDTPGLHKPQDALGKNLNAVSLFEANDSDVILFLLDATKEFGRGDVWVLTQLAKEADDIPVDLIITKADATSAETIDSQIEAATKAFADLGKKFAATVALSAKEHLNLQLLIEMVRGQLPEGPRWFPEEQQVDSTPEDIATEFIREQVLLSCREEIPHATAVIVNELVWRRQGLCHIDARVLVERNSQKAIVVGKNGEMIKKIGMAARKSLETYFHAKIHLTLNVDVAKKWRDEEKYLRQLGYAE